MTDYSYKADLDIGLDGAALEYEAKVFFTYHRGFDGDQIDPDEPATVELTDVHVTMPGRDPFKLGPPALLDALNEALQHEMFEFVAACAEDAAETRYEARRDD